MTEKWLSKKEIEAMSQKWRKASINEAVFVLQKRVKILEKKVKILLSNPRPVGKINPYHID
jgi:vacuolar-type H+-ATPase subunit I/STV1